jgi:hypothetical protein
VPGGYEEIILQCYIIVIIINVFQSVPMYQQHGTLVHQRISLFQRSINDSVSCEGDDPTEWLLDPTITSSSHILPGAGDYDLCLDVENQVGYNDSLKLLPIRISENGLCAVAV